MGKVKQYYCKENISLSIYRMGRKYNVFEMIIRIG